jgi:hypothetical protein
MRQCPEVADSVEKVLSTEAAKNNLTQIEIYNRLLLASQFDLERPTSRRRWTMRPSAFLFGKRFHDAEKI